MILLYTNYGTIACRYSYIYNYKPQNTWQTDIQNGNEYINRQLLNLHHGFFFQLSQKNIILSISRDGKAE